MRLTVHILGLDLLDVEISTNSPSPEPDDLARDLSGGSTSSYPVGFTTYGDQRWEEGLQP